MFEYFEYQDVLRELTNYGIEIKDTYINKKEVEK